MNIEKGYKHRLSYTELCEFKESKEILETEKYEYKRLCEIRTKYHRLKLEAIHDEHRIADAKLGRVLDDINREQLRELNALRKEVGKDEITWEF